jgi:hypothetical protein
MINLEVRQRDKEGVACLEGYDDRVGLVVKHLDIGHWHDGFG